jgi:peptidoglycan/xylan/chitin deacetylase (PgdA/CDA1 family)
MPTIEIALTFDDGPDGRSSANNCTRKVLDVLAAPVPLAPIKAAFFIQTHAPNRLPDPEGRQFAERAHAEGHVLAIHTGSFEDHACHKNRVLAQADIPQTTNGLDSDMKRAKDAIQGIAHAMPRFVRATYGYTNQACMNVYAARQLLHIHWDIDAEDRAGQTPGAINQRLRDRTQAQLNAGRRQLIYLFHDIQPVTGDNLRSFIQTIYDTVMDAGHSPGFCASASGLTALLTANTRPGHDLPCP